MKKTIFTLTFVILAIAFACGQVTNYIVAPTGPATTQVRAPNGLSTQAFLRASSIVLASELSTIPVSTSLSSIGFVTTAGANVPVNGTMTVYMMNSTDATFTLGATWSTIISGMTQVYSGSYTVPASATNIDLTLTTPFVYAGGSVYIAYDFTSAGPFATTAATYGANNAIAGGCVSAASATVAPTTLGSTAFRPTFRFGFANPLTNDISLESINTLGNVANVLNTPVPVSAIVKNNSGVALNNINVSASMTGTNTYSDTKTVASLAAGATATVNFNDWTPTVSGANVLNVSVPADQVNTNNSVNFNTTVSCNTFGAAQNPASFNNPIGFNTGSGIISTPFQRTTATTITGVNIAISTNVPSVGNTVYGVVLNNTGTILATSANLVIANGDLNTIKTFTFSPPVSVAANQLVHFGMAQTANATTGYFPVGSYTNSYVNTTFNTSALTGGVLTPTGNLGQMGLSVNLDGTCTLSVDTVNALNYKMDVYPNPASDFINVKLSSVSDNNTIAVYNTIGQIVIPSQEINGNFIEINITSLSKGVYILKVKNANNDISNAKFVIE
jgi:Secretion system C-terminal sorting domain